MAETTGPLFEATISLRVPGTQRIMRGIYSGDGAGAAWWLRMQADWMDSYWVAPPPAPTDG